MNLKSPLLSFFHSLWAAGHWLSAVSGTRVSRGDSVFDQSVDVMLSAVLAVGHLEHTGYAQ